MTRRDTDWVEKYTKKVSTERYIKALGQIADFKVITLEDHVAVINFGEKFGRPNQLEQLVTRDDDCRTAEDALRRAIDYCLFNNYPNIILDLGNNGLKTEVISRLIACRDKVQNYLGEIRIVATKKSPLKVILPKLLGDHSPQICEDREEAISSYKDSLISTVIKYCGSMKQHLAREEWQEKYGEHEPQVNQENIPMIEGEDIVACLMSETEIDRRNAVVKIYEVIHHLNHPLKEIRLWATDTLRYIFATIQPSEIESYKRTYSNLSKIADDCLAIIEWKLRDSTIHAEVADMQHAINNYRVRREKKDVIRVP